MSSQFWVVCALALARVGGFAPHAAPRRAATLRAITVSEPKIIFDQKGAASLDRETKKLLERAEKVGVRAVNALEKEIEVMTAAEMRSAVEVLRGKLSKLPLRAEPDDKDVAEVFALVREAAWRVLRLRAYDVQMLGGFVMATGALVEMATGEGKTLAAIAPTLLGALRGRGALVVTANDYLARRDADSVGQVHRYLGLSVGLVESTLAPGGPERREAYAADISYVSNQELGFDFLRDQLALDREELVLPARMDDVSAEERRNALFYWCLVDEADSILIDEARTPLIISEQVAAPAQKYAVADDVAKSVLKKGLHYDVNEKEQQITFSEEGFAECARCVGRDIWDAKDPWAPFLMGAVRANALLVKDRDYIVSEDAVSIVDAFSGRVLEGRRWSDGLQQAVEAKEGVRASNETRPAAVVTFQALFRNVAVKLAGMTGTAFTDKDEFDGVYDLRVVPIPTALPIGRKDYDDAVYRTVEAKLRAAAADVARAHKAGRPVLVGTTSIDDSEDMVQRLQRTYGIEAQQLNAKPDVAARESAIVAQAGRLGAVTVATNMAGRGTDIVLGGNAKDLAKACVEAALTGSVFDSETEGLELSAGTAAALSSAAAAAISQLAEDGETSLKVDDAKDLVALAAERAASGNAIVVRVREALDLVRGEYSTALAEEKERVISAGGLYVVGTQRHESRRIDAQLRGRAGRQGDPGASRFFVATEDRIFRTFGGDKIEKLMTTFRVGDDLPLEAKSVTEALTRVQESVESYNFDLRQGVLKFDDVLDAQRRATYAVRRKLLLGKDEVAEGVLREWALAAAGAVLESVVRDDKEGVDSAALLESRFSTFFGVPLPVDASALLASVASPTVRGPDVSAAVDAMVAAHLIKVAAARPQRTAARSFAVLALMRTDTLWAAHLQSMNYLKDSVQLRAYAQKDPFQEYVLEGKTLFETLSSKIKTDAAYSFFQIK
ncbi:SecA DEAD-like domain-containing protein [Pelagophyceae sp. CCMP2097]|nr:SecA DEAD-like domain-containing protein [Pelagophyceae sp. CCMP2097]